MKIGPIAIHIDTEMGVETDMGMKYEHIQICCSYRLCRMDICVKTGKPEN